MIQGTTPTIIIKPKTLKLENCHSIHVTIGQGAYQLDKTDFEIVDNTIRVFLTQEESLKFHPGFPIHIQANGLTADGKRWGIRIIEIEVEENMLKEVI